MRDAPSHQSLSVDSVQSQRILIRILILREVPREEMTRLAAARLAAARLAAARLAAARLAAARLMLLGVGGRAGQRGVSGGGRAW